MATKDSTTLTKRGDGRWQKKYRGKVYYFRGSKQSALAQWHSTLDSLTPEPEPEQAKQVMMRRVSELKPSPENAIYRPVTTESVADLTPSIRRDGVLEPLVITQDDHILSGHRRHKAAQDAGREEVPVRVHPVRRDELTQDEYQRLLVSFNSQRVKTYSEVLHEQAAKLDPDKSVAKMLAARAEHSTKKATSLRIGKRRKRSKIGRRKKLMLDACLEILRRVQKPVSDRRLHYLLLNDPPLKDADDPNSTYRNDRNSYSNLTNLLTRARIERIIPWSWISDDTRPLHNWQTWANPSPYLADQLDNFLTNYYRDLMQSQYCHFEIHAEKNTVAAELQKLAMQYCIPLTSGRGFCSSRPKHDMQQRFLKSGKDRLVLFIVSDLDPAGMAIAESFAASLRDDFGVRSLQAIKVAITPEQVKKYNLPRGEKAKVGRGDKDGLRAEFVRRYDSEYVYEVEALPDGELVKLLDDAIQSALDIDAYNHEAEQERRDFAKLDATREAARELLKGISLDEDVE